MRQYQCNKVVSAFQIQNIIFKRTDVWILENNDGEDVVVTTEWLKKFSPRTGGYYVKYNDGYTSFSPKEPFKDGYTLID